MKKFFVFAAIAALVFTSCADEKVFSKSDGTTFVAEPYGWMTKERKIDGVEYELSTANLVIDVLFCETVAVPILLTGLELWEPVSYTEPTINETK